MSPELQQILDALSKFPNEADAKQWFNENRRVIIPLLADQCEEDRNQYIVVVEEIVTNFPRSTRKLIRNEIASGVQNLLAQKMQERLKPHWRDDVEPPKLIPDKNGKLVPTPKLLVEILEKSKYIRIVYEEHTARIDFEAYGEYKLPWVTSEKDSLVMHYQIDHKEKGVQQVSYHFASSKFQRSALIYYLANFFDQELSWTALEDAINIVANQNRFNVVQDYYNNGIIEWDGNDHMDILHRLAGVKNREWAMIVMHSIMLGIMARTFSPGFNYRGTVVLVGDENLGKSLFCELLSIHKKFYLQFTFDKNTTNAEIGRLLEGRMVTELSDTGGIGTRNDNYIKSFLTQTYDNFRRMRADEVEDIARTCIFIVTTNKMEYYLGVTGNTRFLPCEVTHFDMDAIKAELPQLFAQAKYLWDMGVTPRLTDSELKMQQEMVGQQEVKPNWYYLLVKQLKLENFYPYFEKDYNGFQNGIKTSEILKWYEGELWYSSLNESKYRSEIISVLKRYFHLEEKVSKVPEGKRDLFKGTTDKSYRYTGNDWISFVQSLDD